MSNLNDIFKRLRVPLLLSLLILAAYRYLPDWGITHNDFGLHARDFNHLIGIITVPLEHGSVGHLLGNVFALFSLSALLFIVYKTVALRVLTAAWILTGVFMFLFARGGVIHIGASGVVYALIFYLLVAGIIVKTRTPATIAVIVITYYGSSLWGLLPLQEGVSWDGHLSGAMVGLLLALATRKEIRRLYPQKEHPEWYHPEEASFEDEYEQFSNKNDEK